MTIWFWMLNMMRMSMFFTMGTIVILFISARAENHSKLEKILIRSQWNLSHRLLHWQSGLVWQILLMVLQFKWESCCENLMLGKKKWPSYSFCGCHPSITNCTEISRFGVKLVDFQIKTTMTNLQRLLNEENIVSKLSPEDLEQNLSNIFVKMVSSNDPPTEIFISTKALLIQPETEP